MILVSLGSSKLVCDYYGVGQKISFEKSRVRVLNYTDESCKEFTIKFPSFPREMHLGAAFNKEKRILWFLTNNYVPKVINDQLTFLEQTEELQRRELDKKGELIMRQLTRFFRVYNGASQKAVTLKVQHEDHGEWLLLAQQMEPFEFQARVELFKALLEEFRECLLKKEDAVAKECLEKAYQITNGGFIVKELYADFLAFIKEPKAQELYLELGGSEMGDRAVLFYEKALQADPTKEVPFATLSCTDRRLLHCYVSGYLACPNAGYLTAVKRVNKVVQDELVGHMIERAGKQKQQQDTLKRSRSQQNRGAVWQSPALRSSGPTPPLLGQSRSSLSRLEESAPTVGQVRDLSGKAQELLCLKDPENLEHMEHLLWWYLEKEKWQKAEYIGRILYAKKPKFEFGKALALSLDKLGKKEEAVSCYFALARVQYECKNWVHVASVFEEIAKISSSFGMLSPQEKQLVYLMARVVGDDATVNQLEVLTARRASKEIDFKAGKSRHHFGEWTYFQVDHPQYVACALTLHEKFVFTKTTVEVSSKDADEVVVYPLVIPLRVPDEVALFGAKTVQWLLANGYTPTIQNNTCFFVDTNRQKPKSVVYFDMHRAYIEKKRSLAATEQYAEFLLSVKQPKLALELFLSLAKTPGQELVYLERALVAACSCQHESTEKIYKDVLRAAQKTRASKEYIMRIALHGYLYFQCHDPKKEEALAFLYNKAEGNCTDILVLQAALSCLGMQEKIARRALYQKLCDRIGSTNARLAHVYNHYITKRDLEGALGSTKSLEKFLYDVGANISNNMRARTRDMRQFVQSDTFKHSMQVLKRLFRKSTTPEWMGILERHITAQEYDEAEKVFLQAVEDMRITELQAFVDALYQQWLEFVQQVDEESDLGAFFVGEVFCYLLRSIKDVLVVMPQPAVSDCIADLESCIKQEDYEGAKSAILKAHERTFVTDVQNQMQELFAWYKSTPFVPTWEENFDQLFINCTGYLAPDKLYPHLATDSAVANYLYMYQGLELEEAQAASVKRSVVPKNAICTTFRSRALYCLEHALDHCLRLKDVRTDEVYRLIYAKFQRCDAPIGARFLLCLHAFFHFSDQRVDEAEYFFKEAEKLNPDSLLFACARIHHLPIQATFERQAEFNKIIAVCESERKRVHYLLTQKHFMGMGTFESYLETVVKQKCKDILQNEQLAQLKRAGLAVVDTLVEKSLHKPAEDVFRRLTKMMREFLPGWGKYSVQVEDRLSRAGYSLLKRKLVVHSALQHKNSMCTALETLAVLYADAGNELKVRCVKNILDGLALRPASARLMEFVEQGEEKQAAIGYLELVFKLVLEGNQVEAASKLGLLRAIEPEEHFTADQQLQYELLQTLLADVEDPVEQLEEQFKSL